MLQSSDAGTYLMIKSSFWYIDIVEELDSKCSWDQAYMCSPVLVPQMVGMALLPGAETPKVSTWQVPPWEGRVDIFISIESCWQVMVSTLQTNFKVMTAYAHLEWTLPHCRCSRWRCLLSQRLRIVWLAGGIKRLRAIIQYTWHWSPTSSL